ncbi:hypothetical protein LEP48_01695 [Isoptericola sp. NEAU-Y5]|uniref:DUF4352 domain-containing protein n=1 Tax=Isoptericola luteus TaxID=2879484 RepID=A0ABS7ZAI4_9MICO|nr:hypothetical protein [Isoptericola sp. NEAU-Y5]MCA5892064.1 hypothetical protein [Isoptericola sp. NEAU-Y5]
MSQRTLRLVPVLVAGALALSGCTSGGQDDAAADAADAPAGAAQESGDAAPGGVVGVDFPDPDDVVADATFTVPGTKDEVRVGIESLTVRGETTELRLVFTPQYDDGDAISVFSMLGETSGGLDLIDRENLKEYRTGYTTDYVGAKAARGESVGFQAYFAAPEDDITTIDVKLHDSWPVFEDVPLTVED